MCLPNGRPSLQIYPARHLCTAPAAALKDKGIAVNGVIEGYANRTNRSAKKTGGESLSSRAGWRWELQPVFLSDLNHARNVLLLPRTFTLWPPSWGTWIGFMFGNGIVPVDRDIAGVDY